MTLPVPQRAICFFDGQNLYHAARKVFNQSHPSYDVLALSRWVCEQFGWNLTQIRFYTGVPSERDNYHWHHFWAGKLRAMASQGVYIRRVQVKYHYNQLETSTTPGSEKQHEPVKLRVGTEKQTDVHIAVDLLALAFKQEYDAAVIFSQDSDLIPAVQEVFAVARSQNRPMFLASAFPSDGRSIGIPHTRWIHIPADVYLERLDNRDYRPKRFQARSDGA